MINYSTIYLYMSLSCDIPHIYCFGLGYKDTGLGNILFIISSQYGLHKKYNFKMNINKLCVYLDVIKKFGHNHDKTIFAKILNLFDKDVLEYTVIHEASNKIEIYDDTLAQRMEDIRNNNQNVQIYGYLQSYYHFDEYRNDLLDFYKIDNDSMKYINSKYPNLFNPDIISVSIHIRMNYGTLNYNFNYFNKAIDLLLEQYPDKNVVFYILSNNLNAVKDWFVNKNITYIIADNNPDYIDLWIMTLCKHNIISHSTISWWGAYLNKNPDKIIYYPLDALRIYWGVLNSEPILTERMTEHYMPGWIPVDIETITC